VFVADMLDGTSTITVAVPPTRAERVIVEVSLPVQVEVIVIAGVGTSTTTVALPPGTPEMVVVVVSDPVQVDVIVLLGLEPQLLQCLNVQNRPLLWW
jgi:hypothetical protein